MSHPKEDREPYLRHPNGNGKVFDDSDVCPKTILTDTSSVRGDSNVWMSSIEDAEIVDSDVHMSVIANSVIRGAEVVGANILNSVFMGEIATAHAQIHNSVIGGSSKVGHDAVINDCRFDNFTVRGRAYLAEWPAETVDGQRGYITRGYWVHQPPRTYRTSFGVTVTESVFDKELYAFVACREFTARRWLKIGDRYGKAQNWSPEQVQEVREVLTEWLDVPRGTV